MQPVSLPFKITRESFIRLVLSIALLSTLTYLIICHQSENTDPSRAPLSSAETSTTLSNTTWTGQITPWGVDRIGGSQAQQINQGSGVHIAILDTGIDLDHPDLRVAGEVSFVPGTINGDDDNGHGTKVAGIIGALDNDIGIVGIAPGASLYAVKVIDRNGVGDTSNVIRGIEWSIANHMNIINMSFGDPDELPQDIAEALNKAYQAGIIIVAGAGNNGESGKEDSIYYPAHYDTVISVGCTERNDIRANFSSTGSSLELMAPGVEVMSCNHQGFYSTGNGSSFAASFVSGAAALLFASGINNNQKVRKILQDSAEDLGIPGKDQEYGYGLINVPKALRMAPIH